jgi:polysaccharide biosynthesis transport protein
MAQDTAGAAAGHLDLRDYLQVLRRRAWVIVGVTALCTIAALVLSLLQTPLYASSARILIQRQSPSSGFEASNQRLNADLVSEIESQFFNSEAVRSLARERLGYPASASASAVGRGSVIQVRAVHSEPARAAEIANVYAQAYIDARRESTLGEYDDTAAAIQTKIDEVNGLIALAEPGQGGDYESLITQRATLQKSLDDVEVGRQLAQGGGPIILSQGGEPTDPFRPSPARDAMGGLAVGLLLGIGLALLLEHLDDSIKSAADLSAATGGAPLLAVIPRQADWRNKDEAQLVSLAQPSSPTAEAYRTLRTSVQFAGLERPIRTLQVTSPRAQDGKTTTATNLAVALSRAGQRVILVDCDLRRPRVHEFFGLSSAVGFTSVLVGEAALMTAVQVVPELERLRVLPSGPTPPDPSELLSSRRTADLLVALREAADVVILDTPPVLPVSDALVLADSIDAVMLVVSARSTTKKEAQRAYELLQQVDAPLIGVVMNASEAERGYGYSYGYGADDPRDQRDQRMPRRTRRTRGEQPVASVERQHSPLPE